LLSLTSSPARTSLETAKEASTDVNETNQKMTKMRLRRLLEQVLDADLVQVDVEEEEETQSSSGTRPVKRISLVVRFIET
jgi:hypothetical protein